MAKPVQGGRGNFKLLAHTQAEEDAFDYVKFREIPKPSGITGSVAHIVKGALGGGVLGGHVSYCKAGWQVAIFLNILFGLYMAYCLYLLVSSAQVLYKRTRVTYMSYPDVGEAAMCCCPSPRLAKCGKYFRYAIDAIICIDLFGACATYQLIIAKTLKQLFENTQETSMEGLTPEYLNLRTYMAIMIVPVILICLITHLKWLAPFSLAANFVVLVSLFVTVYYCMKYNPSLSGMKGYNTIYSTFEFTGMLVFSMSCAGVVIPIENNMREPKKFPIALIIGMTIIVLGTVFTSLFGYAAFLEASEAPITVNFPMDLAPIILKGLIGLMIYVTHAINFWPPFSHCFYYLKQLHPPEKELKWELIYRALFVIMISIIAIVFPTINGLMGFLGAFCLSNMAFIWPNVIYLLVIWSRPGFGKYRWRLWRSIFLIAVGIFIWFCGTIVNFNELISVFR